MGRLSTHVLDTMHGCPAAGMKVTLQRIHGTHAQAVVSHWLNADGRAPGPLLEGDTMDPGRYCLLFEVGSYFRERGVALPDPAFLETVRIDFGIADPAAHYHVPLLTSPWAYSTYRGS